MSASGPVVVLFEDEAVVGLGPIVDLRPAWELRAGALNLRERLELCGGIGEVRARLRSSLRPLEILPRATESDGLLQVNARLCGPVEVLEEALATLAPGDAFATQGVTWIRHGEIRRELSPPEELFLLQRPWDLVEHNAAMIRADAATLRRKQAFPRRIFGVGFLPGSRRGECLAATAWKAPAEVEGAAGATFLEPDRILLAEDVVVRPSAVLDATGGPVILGAGVVVHPLSVVTGPAYLGPGTVVNPGAKLREGCSAGAFCKLGGEIEDSVLLDLCNKQHDGFLGHAVVGSWVNLGADTNGSDLKNNYSSVRVDLGEGPIDSGRSFVGPLLADHVKTGIDSMLTTGGVVGVAANVFGGGFCPRFVPAFSWGGPDGLGEYRIDEALRTAEIVFGRRDVLWTPEWEHLLRQHFASTAAQRVRYGVA